MNAVDTNVLIYACDRAAGEFQDRALALLQSLDGAVLLWQVACEFIAASSKLEPDRPSPAEPWQRLAEFARLMPIVVPNLGVLERAHGLHLHQRCSFWDAMVYAACLDAGVSRIYSEDLPGVSLPGLEIVNPFVGLER